MTDLRRTHQGFTLLECLVALAVAGVALAALIGAAATEADALSHQRERTLAGWVAANVAAGVRLERAYPRVGSRSGRAEMGGQTWYWIVDINETPEPALRRLEVRVGRDPAVTEVAAGVTAFTGVESRRGLNPP